MFEKCFCVIESESDLSEKGFELLLCSIYFSRNLDNFLLLHILAPTYLPGYSTKGRLPRELIFLSNIFLWLLMLHMVNTKSKEFNFRSDIPCQQSYLPEKYETRFYFVATLLAGRGWIALFEKKYCMTCEIFSAPFMPIPFNRKMKIRRLMIRKRLRIWIFNEHNNRIWFRISKEDLEIAMTNQRVAENLNIFETANMDGKFAYFFPFSTSS